MTDAAAPLTDELLFSRDASGIARIVLNRPQARNALTFAMYEGLITLAREVEADATVKALIITGAGEKAFAAGTDIAQFRSFETAEDALGYERFMDRVLGALERLRVPTIAAVAGACTGGGAAIAAACDLRVATRDARFGFPIARTLGNCLSQGNLKRLSGLIGPARVKDILFTARLVGAEEALAIGLVSEVVADAAALEARAAELAALLAGHAPLTLQATKEGLRRLQEGDAGAGEDLILQCYMSQDFREGMEAFLAKRPPNWTGR
ncbi:enoyl-CoA hydratase/isomerase family protein [Methylobacterium nigriterrae]|uniref:enoyl-CoA hydratase/isomerase family protein n=1 Tax=Methylobacterium nigriterrae TaxID=3127512 RepID=UPI0030136AF4